MQQLKILSLLVLLFATTNTFSQILSSSDDSGNLQFTGVTKVVDKSNFELSECIAHLALIVGIESKTEKLESSKDSSFVRGKYAYSYYVDHYESPAGEVKFKYEYIIKNGQVQYRFYDFEHEQASSKFKTIGLLPKTWNKKIQATFTKDQYGEIMTDIKLNIAHALRMIDKYCLK